ncbi:polyprenyl synthetase family protein [Phosphitispora fastidiosa]|uniref:polyprenyl synthetase family protein n=1 Tax=Phosphitispora fastidiosa TaxID=2837202 RepID=UPI001E6237F9|nr:farnesyl diphosphate synthase [Phosphitispora fastidiosa]MBU7007661.1 geranylgeranyl diphosphate synthase type II [Phosphitispora fastidiosa]
MNKDTLKREINDRVRLIDQALDNYLSNSAMPETLHQAMRYSVFAGGKRLRPVLLLASAEAVGGNADLLLPAAAAFEMVHTYSLIHDDLPAMDNDDFRRGQPTNHKVFGEAMAILAGDGLLTEAFGLITECCVSESIAPGTVVTVIKELSLAAGPFGMIGGQAADISSENQSIDKEVLDYIHSHKTGALFKACVRAGAIMGGGSAEQLAALTRYAENLGLAFQITDDVLDVEGDSRKLGKTVGSDERLKKATYPSLYGLEVSKKLAADAVDRTLRALDMFGREADLLRYIAGYLLERDN